MVNQERLALGTAALRSGKYPQSTNALRTNAGYCCLGVLTEVAIENGVQVEVLELTGGGWYYDGISSDLVLAVRDWYGFDRSDPELRFDDESEPTSCISANDVRRKTFPEIADALDNTYGTQGDSHVAA